MKFLKVAAFCLALLILGSCGESEKPVFKDEFVRTQFAVTFVLYENETALTKAHAEWLGKDGLKAMGVESGKYTAEGFAVWSKAGEPPACTVHVVKPKHLDDANRFETWGHEVLHCVYGRYHD